jgi:DNA-directed RNA polymerase beta subunit
MDLETIPPTDSRGFFDPLALRKKVLDNAKEAFENKLNKLESTSFKLKVSNLHYPDPNHVFSIQEQKDAILQKKDLSVPLKATIELINKKDNTVVDSKETILARIPWVTQRNTVINHGNEAIVINQQRLKPGVYSRKAKSGLMEGQINIESGSGIGGKVILNPQNQTLYYQIQNSKYHLYSLLHDLGHTDKELEECWGKDLLNRNRNSYSEKEIDKLYQKLFVK